jgi:hypothetical protein
MKSAELASKPVEHSDGLWTMLPWVMLACGAIVLLLILVEIRATRKFNDRR